MKNIIKVFYYISISIFAFISLVLALMNGNKDNIINFENTETVLLLIFSLVMIFVIIGNFLNQKLKYYSLFLSIVVLFLYLIGFLSVNVLSLEGYLLILWVVFTIIANFYIIKKRESR